MHARGEIQVLGEVTNQYAGILPNDPRMERHWALAEALDMPVGIHIGTGPPGAIWPILHLRLCAVAQMASLR